MSRAINSLRRRQTGAALLLLLAIAGVGAATLLVSALGRINLEARRERATVILLSQATDALLGFAIAHGRLPRPAVSATDGQENPGSCEGSTERCTGFLPWVTLGVSGADSWGKLLRYSVVPLLTEARYSASQVVATKTVQLRAANGTLSYVAGQEECSQLTQCVPLVVFSNGRNNLGTSTAGVPQANAASGNVDEVLNDTSTDHFVQRIASQDPDTPGGVFDDLLAWVSLRTLFTRMNQAHTLPP